MAITEDRISLLPDCLVIEILSRLDDTKYAIRTGTLSKRWQHLWPQLSNLFFTHEACRNIPQFYSSLKRILTSQTHQVNKLKLHAYYNDRTEVSNCIRSAISRNVQEVDFRMTRQWYEFNISVTHMRYVLPDFFFTCSSFIRVSLCGGLFEQAGVISWENLRTLHFVGMEIDQNVIENILSGSPLLETLELAYCYGIQGIDITTNKSVKNLRLKSCMYIIHINAPYILSLAIKGQTRLKDLMLLNVSSLINVELNYSTVMQQILIEEGMNEEIQMQQILIEEEMNEKMQMQQILEEEEMNEEMQMQQIIEEQEMNEEMQMQQILEEQEMNEEMQQILEVQEMNEEMLKGHLLSLAHAKEVIIGESCLQTLSRLKSKGFVIPSNLKVLGEIASG